MIEIAHSMMRTVAKRTVMFVESRSQGDFTLMRPAKVACYLQDAEANFSPVNFTTPPTKMAEHGDVSATSNDNVSLDRPGEKRTTSSARQPVQGSLCQDYPCQSALFAEGTLVSPVRQWSLLSRTFGEHSLRRFKAVREPTTMEEKAW